jgi:hypothetical protein
MDKRQINSSENLKNAILDLEIARSEEESNLREQFNLAYESVKPVNLIKSTFKEAVGSSEIKQSLLSVSLGLAAVYFTRKLLEKGSISSVKNLAGTVVMFGITNILARNPEIITNLGAKLINKLRKKHHNHLDIVDIEPETMSYAAEISI